jgi:hypothetical protein
VTAASTMEAIELIVSTYSTWARRNNVKCKEILGGGWYRFRSRAYLLRRAGFQCIPYTVTTATNERDSNGKVVRLAPRETVFKEIADETPIEVVYYDDSYWAGHVIIWRRFK